MKRPQANGSPHVNSKKRRASVVDDSDVNGTSSSMALRVHRCRFIEWTPHAIHAMDFNGTGDQLAVARSNGDLEIWSVDLNWHLKYVISGSEQHKISCLQWSQTTDRLFVASFDGTLWEIDFENLTRKHVTDSNGGPIWCMELNETTKSLAIGCEDGRIRVFSFAHDDDLCFVKGFVTTGRRIVSLAWHAASNRMFSGSEDGLIYCWNATSGRNESRITLETLAKQQCIVWSLVVLDDLTIVSGDSHGNLSFWNGQTGTLQQKFAHLTADILALCVDKSNSMLFASGVDNQVVEFQRTAEGGHWAYCYSHRAHSHDVRALALSSTKSPLLVSGGIDTQLVWYQAESFSVQRPTKIASMPYRKSVSFSSEQRLLLVQKSTSLDLWRLGSAVDETNHKLLVELHLANDVFNMACSALAPNGRFVACSTAKALRLFQLDDMNGFQPHKVTIPVTEPARALAFSPDSTRLVVATASCVHIIDLKRTDVLKTFKVHVPIVSLAVSMDGQWLGTGDASNAIAIYNLDSMQFYGQLPRPEAFHTNIGFNPSGKRLVVTLVSNSFVCYDVEKKGLSDWFRRQHDALATCLADSRNLKGMAFDPAHPDDFLYLYSQSSLYQIAMKKEESDDLCQVVTRYRPLSFVDFLAPKELLVVETPWLKVLSRLPGALQRHKYGK